MITVQDAYACAGLATGSGLRRLFAFLDLPARPPPEPGRMDWAGGDLWMMYTTIGGTLGREHEQRDAPHRV
jgi:hypothetical protein